MVPAFYHSCNKMVSKWESMVFREGSCKLNVMPYFQNMASNVISRTAFGSSYEELHLRGGGKNTIYDIIIYIYCERFHIMINIFCRFLPTKSNRKMKEINKELTTLILDIMNEKEKSMKAGEAIQTDLLSILMESNRSEIKQQENNKDIGMSIEDVIAECKLFYIAGQETTTMLLVWTMILLSLYSKRQERARAKVFEIFGNKKPDYDSLNRLKVLSVITFSNIYSLLKSIFLILISSHT
ncbi:hypothetical protein IC575_016144 [Cucumis melo]